MILVTSADGRWPCDLCQIFVSETGEQRYYLGSLAAANHVKQHNENTEAPISMVLSFCGREMQKIRGQPYEGWEHCFRSANVTHHAWSMDDVKTNHNFRPDVCADMAPTMVHDVDPNVREADAIRNSLRSCNPALDGTVSLLWWNPS